MFDLSKPRTALVSDLTRTRHMLAVSAVVFGSIFVPLVGGPLRSYEIAEIREALTGGHAVVSEAAAAEVPTTSARNVPRTRAPDMETVALTDESEAELTTLELPAQTELQPDLLGSDEGLAVDEFGDEAKTLDEPSDDFDTEVFEEEEIEPNA